MNHRLVDELDMDRLIVLGEPRLEDLRKATAIFGRLVRCAKSRIVEIAVGKEEVQLLDAEVAKIMIDVAIIISAVQHADRRRERGAIGKIGRASCRERVCQYV